MTLITAIQKYSVHDGDGIRTTIFFKGCPLNCIWCHNPETKKYQRTISVDIEKCSGCGNCLNICNRNAISIKGGKSILCRDKCISCGECEDSCILNLRKIIGKQYEIKNLIKEIKKDEIFYEESGGGVTLSGGEVMTMDIDYIECLVKKLNKEGINIAIDTCGYSDFKNFEKILPYVNTFLYDLKAIDDSVHKKYIGVSNKLILENLKKLNKYNTEIYIRIPTIKEVNGDEKSMNLVIDFLVENNIKVTQINLLPYHKMGSNKYDMVGEKYIAPKLHAPTEEEMNKFVEMFKSAGFNKIKIGG